MTNFSKRSCRHPVELISWFELPNRTDSIVGSNLQKAFVYLSDSSLNYCEKDMKEGSSFKSDKTKMAELKVNMYLMGKEHASPRFSPVPDLKISVLSFTFCGSWSNLVNYFDWSINYVLSSCYWLLVTTWKDLLQDDLSSIWPLRSSISVVIILLLSPSR